MPNAFLAELAEELYQEGDPPPEYEASHSRRHPPLNELGESFTKQALAEELFQERDPPPGYRKSPSGKQDLVNELQHAASGNDVKNESKQFLLNELEHTESGTAAAKETTSVRSPGAYSVGVASIRQDDVERQQQHAVKAEVVDEEVMRTQARLEAREELYKGVVPAKAVVLDNEQSKNRITLVIFAATILLTVVIGLAVGLTQRNKSGDDQNTSTLAPSSIRFTEEPTMAPTNNFLENDICALAPPIPGDAGPEVVYTGDLSNTTARIETLGVEKVPFSGYKRWYDIARVGGKRMTVKTCARLDLLLLEQFGLEALNIMFLLLEGADACTSTEEPLEYDAFGLVLTQNFYNEPIGGDPPLLCQVITFDTIPGSEYTGAFILVNEQADLAEDTFFNFSIAINDHCDYAAEVFPDTPILASNQFGRLDTVDIPVCDGVDISGRSGTWYKVQGTDGTLIASTCEGGSATTDTLVAVFGSTCENLSCIVANENSGWGNLKCGRRSEVQWTSTANTTYYIVVAPGEEEVVTPQGGGEFTLTLKSTAAENLCTGALALEPGDAVDADFTFDSDAYTERCGFHSEEEFNAWVDPGIWLSYVGNGKQVELEVRSCNEVFHTFGVSVYTSGPSCSPLDCVEEVINADTREIVGVEESTNCTSYAFGDFLAEDGVDYKVLLSNFFRTDWASFPSWSLAVTLLEEE